MVKLTLNKCLGYGSKPFDIKVPVLEFWRMWSSPSLQLLPGSLRPRVVVRVRASSMDKIEILDNFFCLKPLNCEQANVIEILVLERFNCVQQMNNVE